MPETRELAAEGLLARRARARVPVSRPPAVQNPNCVSFSIGMLGIATMSTRQSTNGHARPHSRPKQRILTAHLNSLSDRLRDAGRHLRPHLRTSRVEIGRKRVEGHDGPHHCLYPCGGPLVCGEGGLQDILYGRGRRALKLPAISELPGARHLRVRGPTIRGSPRDAAAVVRLATPFRF